MEAESHVCLRWNNHQSTVVSVFETLLDSGALVDCTVAAEGRCLKAHRVILSSCSPFFALLFSQHYEKHPIVVLKDVRFQELRAMVDYMYRGEVNISQDQLGALLQAAKLLQIKGLSDNGEKSAGVKVEADRSKETSAVVQQSGVSAKQSTNLHPVTHFPPDTEVVDLSDDSLSSPPTEETPSAKERDTLPVDSAPRASHSFSSYSGNKTGSSSSTTENYVSSVHDNSEEPQVSSSISTLAAAPLASAAVSKSAPEKNLPEVSENNPARIKCENSFLPQTTVSIPPPDATAVTSKGLVQKAQAQPDTPVKSESEVMDTDEDCADDVSRDFTFSDVDCAADREQQSPPDRMNFLSEGMSIERVGYWASAGYSAPPPSKRPSFSRCKVCGKVYKYSRNLKKHMKYECGKEPQFRCFYCPARYTQNGTLRKHLEKHHQNYDCVK